MSRQIDQRSDGFALFIDPSNIGDLSEKRELLEEALMLLNRLD